MTETTYNQETETRSTWSELTGGDVYELIVGNYAHPKEFTEEEIAETFTAANINRTFPADPPASEADAQVIREKIFSYAQKAAEAPAPHPNWDGLSAALARDAKPQ